jgi:hypothetical protein
MIAAANSRVEDNSDASVNQRIREQISETVARYESANPRDVTYRLAQLDNEWDIERALELNFSGVVLAGITLGTISSRKWYLLSAVAACFMVQHVVEGWCPPLAVLRRIGFRTAAEINRERMALKVIRGDFADLGMRGTYETSVQSLLRAVEE